MKEMPPGSDGCPFCNTDGEIFNPESFLPVKSLLANRYIIGRLLDSNGEGATYSAFDSQEKILVRIREFFPPLISDRASDNLMVTALPGSEYIYESGIEAFRSLARNLSHIFDGSQPDNIAAVLHVKDIFDQNGTCYYITETVESITFKDFLLRNGGSLSIEQVKALFGPVLDTLSRFHSVNIFHRGISPDTLIIGRDGRLRITGFCIADARSARTDYKAELFRGYAAIEQYGFDGEQGAFTDVYSVAATIFRTLSGNPPAESTNRVTNDKMVIPSSVADTLPKEVMGAMAGALQILPSDRTKTVKEFKEKFYAASKVKARSDVPLKTAKKQTKKKKNNLKKAGIIISVIIAFAFIILIALTVFDGWFENVFDGGDKTNPNTSPTGTTEQHTSPTVRNPELISIPDFVGKNYTSFLYSTDKDDSRSKDNFKIEISAISSREAVGTIIAQDPPAGTDVMPGASLKLTVSSGSTDFAVPNVIGMSPEQAKIELLSKGFLLKNITEVKKSDQNAQPNTVIEVSPKSGTSANIFMKVIITINSYEPPPTTDYYYPDFE